jgi:glycosyltransferase involved in cell wall biosynthesis
VVPNAPGSPLRGHIDDPRPGAIVIGDTVTLRGWHVWGDQPVLAVAFSADGRLVGHAATGTESRADVAKALGAEQFAEAGWHGVVDLGGAREVTLTVTVWPAPGEPPVDLGPLPLRVSRHHGGVEPELDEGAPNRFHGALELPPEGTALERDAVNLVGWALTDRLPVSRLEVTVNGEDVGRARLGLQRPDVARHYRAPHAEVSGFEHLVDLSALAPGTSAVRVEVRARSLGGESEVVARRRYQLAPVAAVEDRSDRAGVLGRRLEGIRASVRPGDALDLVVFTHDLGYGGGQLWLSELLRQAGAGSRFACTVVSPISGPLLAEFEERGIEVHITQEYPVTDIEQYEGRVVEAAQWLATRGHNAALVNTFGAFFGADVATRLGLPTVWGIHESWSPSVMWSVAYPAGHVDPLVQRAAYGAIGAAGALVFEAEQTRRQFEPWAAPGRAVVVPYGIDATGVERYRATTTPEQARRATRLPARARVLLVMATTERRKGQTVLAEAFARIARSFPDALLVFVGDTGTPYAEALARLIRRSGIERQTRLLPVVEDTYRWYRAADVVVCASDVESLPRSVLEAMCFGVPVLTTSVFGLTDLLTDDETGFLFEPLDLTAAIGALRRVLELDAPSLARVASAGRQLVRGHYDSAGYATDVVDLLEGLRRDPTRTPAQILSVDGRSHRTMTVPTDAG